MNFTRRFFIGGAACLGAVKMSSAFGAAAMAGAKLKMGVLSDIHLEGPGSEGTLIKALEYFRDHGVEAVLVAGDTCNTGRYTELKLWADTWFKVFPNDKAPDGRHVERLFIFGNHCIGGWAWGNDSRKDDPAWRQVEAIGCSDNRYRMWEECFHEKYEPIWMKTVNGIPVIGAHWENRAGGNQIEAFMKAHGGELDPKSPFVYTQHDHPRNTCFGSWAWGRDDGRATRALSPFPNAVAFSGHSHYTLTDERSVWQGAFTSINTASLRYASVDYSLRENINVNDQGFRGENRPHRMPQDTTYDGRQGMIVSFFGDHLAIERREFVYGESLGPDWIVPLPAAESKPFSYTERAKKRVAPRFDDTAVVTVNVAKPKDEKDFSHVELSFPAAQTVDNCRVFEYEVTAILCEDDVELVQAQRRMMSPDYYRPASKLVNKVAFTFAAEDLPIKGHYRFEVRPIECLGHKGRPIVSPLIKVIA